MALTVQEVTTTLATCDMATADALEKVIDELLKKHYSPAERRATFTLANWPNQRVQDEISKRFGKAGWTVTFHPDQRDSYLELSH